VAGDKYRVKSADRQRRCRRGIDGSGLRDRSANLERSGTLISIPSSGSAFGCQLPVGGLHVWLWRKPPCRRCSMSRPRPVSALIRR
jgi:hypothetical protein